jgi:hypothetical protein
MFEIIHIKKMSGQTSEVHTCNPHYSGGRHQEDHDWKPAQANSLQDPISKTPSQKMAGRVAQGVSLSPITSPSKTICT